MPSGRRPHAFPGLDEFFSPTRSVSIAAEPWKPDSIVAAVGLVHFEPYGRVVKVCGDRVQRLHYDPYRENRSTDGGKNDGSFGTVALFGLTRESDTLWGWAPMDTMDGVRLPINCLAQRDRGDPHRDRAGGRTDP
jgi:hypothetical protein